MQIWAFQPCQQDLNLWFETWSADRGRWVDYLIKYFSKVQNVLWNYGTLQIWPYLGASSCWGYSVLQTPALVSNSFCPYRTDWTQITLSSHKTRGSVHVVVIHVVERLALLTSDHMSSQQMVQATWSIWPPCPLMKKKKKLKISSSLELKGWWLRKLVCSIGYLSTTKFVQMMTLGLPWPIYDKVIFGPLCFCMGKGKTMDFSETVVIPDIKVGRFS